MALATVYSGASVRAVLGSGAPERRRCSSSGLGVGDGGEAPFGCGAEARGGLGSGELSAQAVGDEVGDSGAGEGVRPDKANADRAASASARQAFLEKALMGSR